MPSAGRCCRERSPAIPIRVATLSCICSSERIRIEPFNAIATAIFLLAIVHTFSAARFARRAHAVQHAPTNERGRRGLRRGPAWLPKHCIFSARSRSCSGCGPIVLLVAMVGYAGWDTAKHYFNDTVNYTEPLFVVVIMALAATRPIMTFAERALRRVADVGRATPAAWWMSILIIGPLLGSFMTEPAAMTICAILLARQFFDLEPSTRLKYATLGLLFVNVSIGGTLTHFAAPPVLMVARPWDWDFAFMLGHFGWKAALSIAISTLAVLPGVHDANSPTWRVVPLAHRKSTNPTTRRGRAFGLAARPEVDHRRAHGIHGLDGPDRTLSRRCSSAGF